MIHDELMDKVEKTLGSYISTHYGSNKDIELRVGVIDSLQALLAVVELHKPWKGARMGGGGFNGPWCSHCEEVFDGSIRYPCPTIEAVDKALV